MNSVVNQAYEQWAWRRPSSWAALSTAPRATRPRASGSTQAAMADVRSAVAERDAPFGDYGQERGCGAPWAPRRSPPRCWPLRRRPEPRTQVRETLDEFRRATAAKDYQVLRPRVPRPARRQARPRSSACEVAMQRSFEDVENPRLRRTNQKRRPRTRSRSCPVEDDWRISSLG